VRQKWVPWESSQHARTLADGCPVSLTAIAAGDPIIADIGLAAANGEKAEEGTRRRGAEGSGAARMRGADEAARPRTAARKEREAAPRDAMARGEFDGGGGGGTAPKGVGL
jgi:hypothetical protein